MTPQQLDLLAVIGCATCWGAVLLAWLGGSHDLLRGRPFPAGVL